MSRLRAQTVLISFLPRYARVAADSIQSRVRSSAPLLYSSFPFFLLLHQFPPIPFSTHNPSTKNSHLRAKSHMHLSNLWSDLAAIPNTQVMRCADSIGICGERPEARIRQSVYSTVRFRLMGAGRFAEDGAFIGRNEMRWGERGW